MDVPVTEDAKIKIGNKDGKLSDLQTGMAVTLRLVEDQGGLVVVGIQTIGKSGGQKPNEKKP